MLKLELKRLLKTRSTWWLTVIALALCVFYIYAATHSGLLYQYVDENDEWAHALSLDGYQMKKESLEHLTGEITPEFISRTVASYHELLARYGSTINAPNREVEEVVSRYGPVWDWVYWSFTDPETGAPLPAEEISPEKAMDFYSERLHSLEMMLGGTYAAKGAPQVVDYAMARADNGKGNFYYSYGIGSTSAADHLGALAAALALICAVIAAPVFSADYQSGADDILRCTRKGRRQLGLTKLCATLIICLGLFLLCEGIFMVAMAVAFGLGDHTSGELLELLYNPDGLTAMGIIGLVLLQSFLTCLAMTGFTLFLSSRFHNSVAALSVAAAVGLMPTVMRMVALVGNLPDWIKCCIPSGGVSLDGAMSYALRALRFVWIGDFVIWTPHVMLVASAVQIPIWLVLALVTYTRHQAA